MKKVKINKHDMMMLVNPCSLEFISKFCYARCCRNSSLGLGYALIMPFDKEIEYFMSLSTDEDAFYDEKLGAIKLKTNQCPVQDSISNLCGIHNTGLKPFGCRVMPLIIINDQIKVRSFIKYYYCQKNVFPGIEKVPFYIGFRQSLVAVLGEVETDRVILEIESDKKEIEVYLSDDIVHKMDSVRNIISKATQYSK